jgi:pyruvate/2-oxoglutarate dehydrogenase complex dihydrolipoamide acyltransferase (E2) component
VSSSSTEVMTDVTMPQMGVSVAEGTIVAWRVEVGDRIEADATICEITTDKIDTELPAPVSGVVAEILVPVGETVAVGTVVARIGGGAIEPAPAEDAGPATGNGGAPPSPPAAPLSAGRSARYSPVVQRIAAEHGIDLAQVRGTGRGGRVRKQDVLAVVESQPEPPLHIESPYVPEPVAPVADGPAVALAGDGQLSRMRRQIGAHMKRSLETAATCTTWAEVDMSRIEAARKRDGFTALPFVAAATIAALREHPALNATLEGENYIGHADVNLGIAVSLGEDGLIVPVIHRAHELSVEGLAPRIKELARRARAHELRPDDVAGGTFTITNPGQFGSIMATPIINQPQVAILDLEAVVKRPVVVSDAEGNDSIAIRAITILGLSWDHRALDGALAAQFLATLKRRLEAWS